MKKCHDLASRRGYGGSGRREPALTIRADRLQDPSIQGIRAIHNPPEAPAFERVEDSRRNDGGGEHAGSSTAPTYNGRLNAVACSPTNFIFKGFKHLP